MDAADAVRYLVQAEFVTGTILTVDGGRSVA
jgi:NAD(P)-dependent dehydrogenase (short-subunit alcohol dehydrogenase family)